MTDNPTTDSNNYDVVTARDIADFLHHLADLRCRTRSDDPAEQAAFQARKAELFTRIADQSARSYPRYAEQVRQMANDAHAAANPELPQPRVGPNQKRTTDHQPDTDGAKSQKKSGASSG